MSLYTLHKLTVFAKLYGASDLACLAKIDQHKAGRRLPARTKAKLSKEVVSSTGLPYLLGYKGCNKYLAKVYNLKNLK